MTYNIDFLMYFILFFPFKGLIRSFRELVRQVVFLMISTEHGVAIQRHFQLEMEAQFILRVRS